MNVISTNMFRLIANIHCNTLKSPFMLYGNFKEDQQPKYNINGIDAYLAILHPLDTNIKG